MNLINEVIVNVNIFIVGSQMVSITAAELYLELKTCKLTTYVVIIYTSKYMI